MEKYIVVKKRKSDYPNPINLKTGDIVKVGETYSGAEDWNNWIKCSKDGIDGWVPAQIIDGNGTYAKVLEDYDATELDIQKNDIAVGLFSMNGWVRGYLEHDSCKVGWVPLDHLRRIE